MEWLAYKSLVQTHVTAYYVLHKVLISNYLQKFQNFEPFSKIYFHNVISYKGLNLPNFVNIFLNAWLAFVFVFEKYSLAIRYVCMKICTNTFSVYPKNHRILSCE